MKLRLSTKVLGHHVIGQRFVRPATFHRALARWNRRAALGAKVARVRPAVRGPWWLEPERRRIATNAP